jgi:hypothetical protein
MQETAQFDNKQLTKKEQSSTDRNKMLAVSPDHTQKKHGETKEMEDILDNCTHVGMNTSPVLSTGRPKPLSFEYGVQTLQLPERPVEHF